MHVFRGFEGIVALITFVRTYLKGKEEEEEMNIAVTDLRFL